MFRSVNGYIIKVTANLMETVYFLGIDIAKKTVQVALTVDGVDMYELEVENSSTAIRSYFMELKKKFNFSSNQLIVCLEHTGIYSYPVLDYLTKMGLRSVWNQLCRSSSHRVLSVVRAIKWMPEELPNMLIRIGMS